MDLIHVAIVEDEPLFVQQLKEYIGRYEKDRGRRIKITTFADGEDITDDYRGGYDIILMDIQMRFMDGMTAAEKIRTLDHEVIIMFITNMIQYAVRGYEVDAMDYVVKPVEYFAFSQKLDKAIGRMKKAVQTYISVPTEDGLQKLAVSDIYYIESSNRKVTLYLRHEKIEYYDKISSLESELKPDFFRIHKGYLVNIKYVERYDRTEVKMRNGDSLLISKYKYQDFVKRYLEYISEER